MDSIVRKLVDPIVVAGEVAVQQINNKVRAAVSKDKIRFKNAEYDLDLTYINNRLIAMGFPGTSVEKAWRNSRDDIARFLNEHHKDHYMIFNVSEKAYDPGNFANRAVWLGWPDHHPPTLAILTQCVQMIDSWLNEDPQNVAVIHCMAGRGRTGTVIASYLLHCKAYNTAEEALAFFATQRSATGEGVVVPSQRRYVKYFEQILNGQIPLSVDAKQVVLKSIVMRPVPTYDMHGQCTPSIQILRMGQIPQLLFSNQNTELRSFSPTADGAIVIEMGDMILQGDVLIRVYHESFVSGFIDRMMFRFVFHTSFITSHFFDLFKKDLDDPNSGVLKDYRFPEDFCVRLMFSAI